MSGADKNARGQGGLDVWQITLTSYSIIKKQQAIKGKIIHLRQSWHLEIADFQRFAIFTARVFLDYAPPEVRVKFTGAPDDTPRETIELAETFLLLYAIAEDLATAADAPYSLEELWQAAIKLAGVAV
jgi:hypothetical protein